MRSCTTWQLTPPPSEHAALIYIQVGAVSLSRFGCLHDSQKHVDTATLWVFLNLSSRGKEFRKKLTQYITMSVIPCPEGLILPDPIKSSVRRRWWYYFWTYSTANKGFQIWTSDHCGVLGFFCNTLTKTPGLCSREISCLQAKRFLLLQTTRKLGKGDKITGCYFILSEAFASRFRLAHAESSATRRWCRQMMREACMRWPLPAPRRSNCYQAGLGAHKAPAPLAARQQGFVVHFFLLSNFHDATRVLEGGFRSRRIATASDVLIIACCCPYW